MFIFVKISWGRPGLPLTTSTVDENWSDGSTRVSLKFLLISRFGRVKLAGSLTLSNSSFLDIMIP